MLMIVILIIVGVRAGVLCTRPAHFGGLRPVSESSSLRFSSRPWGFEFSHAYMEQLMDLIWFNTLPFVFGLGI